MGSFQNKTLFDFKKWLPQEKMNWFKVQMTAAF